MPKVLLNTQAFSCQVVGWRCDILKDMLDTVYTRIFWCVCWKPEVWSQQRQSLLRNGSVNTPVAGQWLSSRHVKASTYTHATIEELYEAVISVRSVPRLYNDDQLSLAVISVWKRGQIPPLWPCKSKEATKRKSQIWDSKIWSQGTRTREKVLWQKPAAYIKDRPVLSLQRASHKNKTVTVKQ
jgi:hypothetical protein